MSMGVIGWDGVTAIATVLALLAAVVTFVLSANRERRIRRADLVRSYTTDFYASPAVPQLFMEIDYQRFTFDRTDDTWLGGAGELDLVRMLDLFNSVGHNYKRRVVLLDDIHGTTLGYAVLRAHDSTAVRDYLEHVKVWDNDHLGTGVPFQYFQELGNALRTRSEKARRRNAALPAVILQSEEENGPQAPAVEADPRGKA